MADFNIALAELLQFEGGYSNNSADAGGETYAGISRHFNPTWAGWLIVDSLKKQEQNLVILNMNLAASPELRTAVASFYHAKYWSFDAIPSQLVANKLFEMEVNFGTGSAVRILQQGLIRLGVHLDLDGNLGPTTLAAVKTQKEPDLLHALRAYSALARVHIVQSHPEQMQFIEGWLWRDSS